MGPSRVLAGSYSFRLAGMAAISAPPDLGANPAHSFPISAIGVIAIVLAALIVFGLVYLFLLIKQRFAQQAEQLKQSGIQLQTIFDNLMEGIIVLDRQNNLLQINPAAIRILGLPYTVRSLEAIGDVLELRQLDGTLLPKDQWPSARAVRGEYVRNFELELRSSHTGHTAIIEVGTAPIVNATGDPVQSIMTYRDVTDRMRTQQARAHLVAIVESSQDAIIGKDLNGIITSWNKGAETIFGFCADEMIGQSILRLLPAGREDEEAGTMERVRQGETIEQLETTWQRKGGRLIQVSAVISPIRDSGNRVVGASRIARDITEKKLLERQLRQSQKMEAIGQLTGGIAHDFNNLLAIVIGNLGLLERMVADNVPALDRLRPAQKAANRGADLTRRLLALASKEDLNPAITRLQDAIRETIELARRAFGPEIRILTHLDASVPPVFVDASCLESALLNLAVNARDAMPKGGTLNFNTQLTTLDESFPSVLAGELSPGVYASISVSDTGQGMSREIMERAMEPFFTTKSRQKGTGLGLSMVYGFARQSGGTVRLYSEEGHGTTVSIYLPIATAAAPVNTEIAPDLFTANAGGTVLVVDDETDLLDIAHAYLTEMGFSALRADNASAALANLEQFKKVDLMITDIIMPGGMNGVELAEKARELIPDLKVIYSSGFPADALIERNGTRADDPMLRKPYNRAEFAAMIHRTLEGPAN